MTINPVDKLPPGPMPVAPTPPVERENDHDGDDGATGVKPGLPRGVGERLDKTA